MKANQECVEAVRDYMRHAGGCEVEQAWLALERRYTPAQIRAALKSLAAIKVKSWNSWPTLRSTPSVDSNPFTAQKFTFYRLPEAA